MTRFPIIRPRRLRENATLRSLVAETQLTPQQLIQPLFLKKGKGLREPISSMPGIFRLSPDEALKEVKELLELKIQGVLLFGLAEHKDELASEAYDAHGVVPETLKLLKKKFPNLLLIADVCLCEYMSHGHCGVVVEEKGRATIDNDHSLELLTRTAAVYARAGADVLAPSDMMDGRVQAIRDELDAAGFKQLPILSYAAKYASSFYGPFREALHSSPQFGDRKSYQMDPANAREALKEVRLDIAEGADMVMIKPALPCLDIIAKVKHEVLVPVGAYQVSGEYAMIKQAGKQGMIDESAAMQESLLAIKRAGADFIITYFAKDFAKGL